ncbi:MAG: LCP family protein [Thermoleophilia bacterium]|nr:LCP family protein [Thermoleophilia bacterium]
MTNEEKHYTKYKSSRFRIRSKPLKRDAGQAPRDDAGGSQPAGEPPGGLPPKKPGSLPARPRRRGRWGRRAAIFLLFLLIVALALAGFFYWRLDREVRASNARVPDDVAPVLARPAGSISSTPVNILFLGTDQRPGEPARADTILLMRVNGRSKTMSQLSIPRDTLADIPGYGEEKINSAYAYGGPSLMIEAVEDLTGIPIHHFVELDFAGFPAIVDTLGGVDINVPAAIDSQYPAGYDWTEVHFDAGPQRMDGERALVYVRVRYSDDDFQRMGRQQQFMEALQRKLSSPGNLVRMPLIAPDLVGNMTTDLSTDDLIWLSWVKFRTPAEKSRKLVLPGDGLDIGGVSYVVLDGEARQVIQEFLSS